jgi:hypothetical protein
MGLLIPAPILAAGTLLDRPFVEMLLWIPLSLLGASGIAGLIEWTQPGWHRFGQAAATLILLAVVAHAFVGYCFHPSPCCSIAAADDLVALEWLKENLSTGGRVAVASTQLRVAPVTYAPLEAPVDAGAWVQPLTGISTIALPSGIDFGDEGMLTSICASGVTYVYVGDALGSFDSGSLQGMPAWYRLRLQLPLVSIYEVIACQK